MDNWDGTASMVDALLRIGNIFDQREAQIIVKQLLFDKYVCDTCGHKYNVPHPDKTEKYFPNVEAIENYQCEIPLFIYNPTQDWHCRVLTKRM